MERRQALLAFVTRSLLLLALWGNVSAGHKTFSLSGVLMLELVPSYSYSPTDCVLGNCTADRVTNIFLTDVVDGAGPCFVAENLGNRALGTGDSFSYFFICVSLRLPNWLSPIQSNNKQGRRYKFLMGEATIRWILTFLRSLTSFTMIQSVRKH